MESFFYLFNKFFLYLNTILHKYRFKKFGKNSFISYGVKMVNPKNIVVGDNVFIGKDVFLNTNSKKKETSLFIGNNVHIARGAHINAYYCVYIEDYNIIGENVFLGDADHEYSGKDIPIYNQGIKIIEKEVRISQGCHIGMNACIAPGISIGKNNVVAPNSYVTRNTKNNLILLGNPAREFPHNIF